MSRHPYEDEVDRIIRVLYRIIEAQNWALKRLTSEELKIELLKLIDRILSEKGD